MLPRFTRRLLPALILCGLWLTPAAAQQSDPRALLHLLDYIGVDYPNTVRDGQVINPTEYAEQQEFATRANTLIASLPAGAARDNAQAQADELRRLIDSKANGPVVSRHSEQMRAALIGALQVVTTPRGAPDLARGATLFAQQCGSCHGADGMGNGPAALNLEPAPTNFLDRARADQRSLYGLYSTITLGVTDTAMPAFGQLSDADRWALAFHVGGLAYADAQLQQRGDAVLASADQAAGLRSLAALTTTTPAQAIAQHGDDGLAALARLRHDPAPLFAGSSPLDTTIARLHDSLAAYADNQPEQAYTLALAAYLDGFELAESALRATDPELVRALETRMLDYRQLIQSGMPLDTVRDAEAQLVTHLQQARGQMDDNRLSPGMAMGSAFVILLREGLEALLVLAAIIGILIKTGRRDALPYVHAGWIGALALGFATWGASIYLVDISGASRELTEGGTAVLAAVVLLYVGFWLHDKAHASQWQAFVKKRIQGALSGRALWALALVAFLAVYREVFETVLFYQALWMQAESDGQSALLGGFGLGVAALLAIGWIILKSSVRLPLNAFFRVNAAIMFVLAVVFAGHGVAGLQKAGILRLDPVSFPRIDLLGIYPNLESLGAQLLVILLVTAMVLAARIRSASTPV